MTAKEQGALQPPRGRATASTVLLRSLRAAGNALGLDANNIIQSSGVDLDWLNLGSARVPVGFLRAAWLQVQQLSGDPSFGVRAAELLPLGALGLIDEALACAPTCRLALEHIVPHTHLLANFARFSQIHEGPHVVVRYEAREGLMSLGEFTLALLLLRLRLIGDESLTPVQASLPSSPPSVPALMQYQRIFGCRLHFAQPSASLTFPRASLDVPTTHGDYRAFGSALARLEREGASSDDTAIIAGDDNWYRAIRAVVRVSIHDNNPTLAKVAQILDVSPRTLQRRLSRVGLSHRELLEHLRQEMRRELAEKGISTRARVARALAYGSARSFERAVRRWRTVRPGDSPR